MKLSPTIIVVKNKTIIGSFEKKALTLQKQGTMASR
jgi:hypothetical protein